LLPVGGTDWQSFVYLHANDLSYYDVIIQAHELRATKDYREYIFVSERMCVHIQSIDACILRRSRDESLGPWYYEARVRFC